MAKKIVILGAGYAGVLTAKKLAKKLKKNSDITITVIDKNPYHTMLTELHEVAANRTPESHVRISLAKIFAGRRVDIKLDTIESIDFDKKRLTGKADSYTYDYLVMAAGSKPTFFGTPGAEEFSFKLWSFDDAVTLKHHVIDMFRKAVKETDPAERKKLLSFYVVGAGFTGIEMAGELAEWVPYLCEEYEIGREEVEIVNVDLLDRVVPTFPEKLSVKAERRLCKMGVDVMLKTGVCSVGDGYIELKKDGQVTRRSAGTVVWTAGIEASEVVCSAQGVEKAGRGRIVTDSFLRAKDKSEVYVAGDNVFYKPEGESAPVPQMVENAEQSAHTVARNIIADITGEKPEEYNPKFHGAMLCIGSRYGTAYVGTAKKKFALASFFAMFAKHFINLVYFIQVAGWNKIASYMKNEFFAVRNRRSFVGGHFSNRTPSFLLVPLRIWLGMVWLFEGIMKIVEGWLTTPKLSGFFSGANSWFEGILNPGTADATSSATGAATSGGASAGSVIFNIDFLGIFDAIFVSGKPVAESTIADYAFKIDFGITNWFINNLILPYPGMALTMQIFIVVMEILIGLSLMGGLLTTFSSVVSLVLLFMFTMTTGLYLSSFWMIFAAIAMMFGAGKIFGLDYYALPLMKRGWKKIGWVRKSYLYND